MMASGDQEKIQCPACGKAFRWKPELAGRSVRCKGCGNPFKVPTSPGSPGSGPGASDGVPGLVDDAAVPRLRDDGPAVPRRAAPPPPVARPARSASQPPPGDDDVLEVDMQEIEDEAPLADLLAQVSEPAVPSVGASPVVPVPTYAPSPRPAAQPTRRTTLPPRPGTVGRSPSAYRPCWNYPGSGIVDGLLIGLAFAMVILAIGGMFVLGAVSGAWQPLVIAAVYAVMFGVYYFFFVGLCASFVQQAASNMRFETLEPINRRIFAAFALGPFCSYCTCALPAIVGAAAGPNESMGPIVMIVMLAGWFVTTFLLFWLLMHLSFLHAVVSYLISLLAHLIMAVVISVVLAILGMILSASLSQFVPNMPHQTQHVAP